MTRRRLVRTFWISAAAAGEIDRAVGRREDDDFVAAAAQLLRRGLHVLVDRVRLRPRKRRDHADPKAHASSLARFTGSAKPGYVPIVTPGANRVNPLAPVSLVS